jgi:sulfane dehydrogenase subunit SoxC
MASRRKDRRGFLAGGGAALVGLAAGARPLSAQNPEVPGKDIMPYGERSRFERTTRIRLGNKVNMNMHGDPNGYDALSPIGEQVGIVTPAPLHFISSHGNAPPDIDPARHRLIIHGMVDRPLVFTMDELKRLPSVSRIHFIECLANRPRSGEQRTLADNHGMISCSEWTGVPVSVLLKEAGVKAGGNWIIGESAEATRGARSAPVGKMMLDALVAYGQNGEAIRPQQGYPLRLVIPGFEGKYHVKWLKGIKVVDRPYVTYWEHGTFMGNANAKGQYFMEQGPKSVITFPAGGQKLKSRGFHTIVGFAWTGSGAVRRVEVSTDGGRTWNDAQLQEPVLPLALARFQFPWTWNGGEAVLQSRCTDEAGQVQPTSAEHTKFWAPMGAPHGNMIQPWRITNDGQVLNAL